jgi:hypothetical protein
VVQPETGDLFVAEAAAGQVVRIDQQGKVVPVITGFLLGKLESEWGFEAGPLSLCFLSKRVLLVGSSGGDQQDLLRVFVLDEQTKQTADAAVSSIKIESPYGGGVGGMLGLAASPNAVFVSQGYPSAQVSRINRSGVEDVGQIDRFLDSKAVEFLGHVGGLAISPYGYLVMCQAGKLQQPDGQLAFFDSISGRNLRTIETDLVDPIAVAYSPRRQMYLLDFGSKASSAGLYRITEDRNQKPRIKSAQIAKLEQPTSLTFDNSGDMFVTLLGSESTGQLVKIVSAEQL